MGKQRLPKPDPRVTKPQLKALKRNRAQNRQTVLRKSMTPGTVAVVLIGPYQAKKVVFLKQLNSGLLLCACLNNNSVRRFPQKWLMATSQNVDVSGVSLNFFNDKSFAGFAKKSSDPSEFFQENQQKATPESKDFADAKDKVLKSVGAAAKKETLLFEYCCARFTLDKEVPAHALIL